MHDRFFAFDFDGVLANSLMIALEEYARIIRAEFPTVPVPNGPDDLVHMFPGPLRTSLRRFGLDDTQSRRFFDLHSAAMRGRADDIQLFASVADILLELPFNRRAIVTSAYSEGVRSVLKRSGLGSAEVQIFGRELHLPKSEKFRRMAEDNDVALDAVVKIGDMVSDILYAREAGISMWVVGWGYHPISYLAAFGPDECVETPFQLRARITEL